MSEITDLIRRYADGELTFEELRDDMRQVQARPRPPSDSPWLVDDDDLDIEGSPDELATAATIYDLSPEEYRLLVYDLAGTPVGLRRSESPPKAPREEGESEPSDTEGMGGNLAGDGEPKNGVEVTGPIEVAKMDHRRNLVFGWANVALTPEGQVVDGQGDLIDVEELENAAYQFVVKYRVTGDMHRSEGFGELVESLVVTQDKVDEAGFPPEMLGRWWVGFRVPPQHWDNVVSGKRRMFSIQGRAKRIPLDDISPT